MILNCKTNLFRYKMAKGNCKKFTDLNDNQNTVIGSYTVSDIPVDFTITPTGVNGGTFRSNTIEPDIATDKIYVNRNASGIWQGTGTSPWTEINTPGQSLEERLKEIEKKINESTYPQWPYGQQPFSPGYSSNWSTFQTQQTDETNKNFLYYKIEAFVRENFIETYIDKLRSSSTSGHRIECFGIDREGKANSFYLYLYPKDKSINEFLKECARIAHQNKYLDFFGPVTDLIKKSMYVDKCEENNRIWPTFYKKSPRKDEYIGLENKDDAEEALDKDLPWIDIIDNFNEMDIIDNKINNMDYQLTPYWPTNIYDSCVTNGTNSNNATFAAKTISQYNPTSVTSSYTSNTSSTASKLATASIAKQFALKHLRKNEYL